MVSLEDIVDAGEHVRGGRYRKVSPWFIPEILINIAAGHVSLAYGFKVWRPCLSMTSKYEGHISQ